MWVHLNCSSNTPSWTLSWNFPENLQVFSFDQNASDGNFHRNCYMDLIWAPGLGEDSSLKSTSLLKWKVQNLQLHDDSASCRETFERFESSRCFSKLLRSNLPVFSRDRIANLASVKFGSAKVPVEVPTKRVPRSGSRRERLLVTRQ